MDYYFEEKGIQKEETKHIQLYGGQSAGIVFDVQLLAWSLRSCSTDGVKNALLISDFIKFNPLFFQRS